jgi:hypothetical protein
MANRIPEPASTNPQTLDWQTLLNKLTTTTGAFTIVGLASGSDGRPVVKNGSRFEVNGAFFSVQSGDEPVNVIGSLPIGDYCYIYAMPDHPDPAQASTCTFLGTNIVPVMDIVLGGLFNGPWRCLGWAKKNSDINYSQYTIAFSQYMIEADDSNALYYSDGKIRFKLPVLTDAQSALTQVGDLWIYG